MEVEEIPSVCCGVVTDPLQPDPLHVVTASATVTEAETEAGSPATDVIDTTGV